MDNEKQEIKKLLNELKWRGEAFNEVGGFLYSNILADEMTSILNDLKSHDVEVSYYQHVPGRIHFNNLDELIKKYD